MALLRDRTWALKDRFDGESDESFSRDAAPFILNNKRFFHCCFHRFYKICTLPGIVNVASRRSNTGFVLQVLFFYLRCACIFQNTYRINELEAGISRYTQHLPGGFMCVVLVT